MVMQQDTIVLHMKKTKPPSCALQLHYSGCLTRLNALGSIGKIYQHQQVSSVTVTDPSFLFLTVTILGV